MRSVKLITILILTVMILSSCEKGKNVEPKSTSTNSDSIVKFTPPKNGIITDQQIYKYIKVAKMLQNQIAVNAKERKEVLDSYKIVNDSVLADTIFMKKHPEVQKSLDSLEILWKNRENKIYSSVNFSEDEFIWIASVLPDSINSKMRKIVRDSLGIK